MLPFHEFKAASLEFNRRSLPAISWLFGLIGIGVAYALFALTHLPSGQHVFDQTERLWAGSAFAVLLTAVVCGMALLVRLVPDRMAYPKLHCPNCNRFLCEPHGLAVATGRCPSCLKDILKLESLPLPTVKLLSIAELQRIGRRRTIALRLGLVVFGAGCITSILFAIAYYYLLPLALQATLAEANVPLKSLAVFLVAIPLPAALLYAVFSVVCCPHCRARILHPSIVIASGNCPRCSRPIVENAMPFTEYRPLPKLAQVSSAFDAYTRGTIVWLFMSLILAAATIGPVGWLSQNVLPDTYQANVARVILYLVATSIAVAPCFYIVRRSRSSGYAALNCVHCGGVISEAHSVARCTGNCPHCGQRAIKDA